MIASPPMSSLFDLNMIVLVIGMHRSGTSVISRSLKVFGIDHGDKLLTGADNAKGHWEDLDLLQMNDLLLAHVGKTWSSMSMITPDEIGLLLSSDLRTDAAQLIANKVRRCRRFGFKDPRTTLLLPFWQQVMADCDLRPVYLFVVREPRAVVESLSKRDHFEMLRSIYLWINYNLCAFSFLRHCRFPVSVVDYNQLLASPEARMHAIADQTGLPLCMKELDDFINLFLDESLNHSSAFLDPGFHCSSNMPLLADAMYQCLIQMCDSPQALQSLDTSQLIQTWCSQLDEIQALLRLADGDFQRAQTASRAEAESRQVRHELSIIYQSTSWRLTAPLRRLKNLLHSPLASFLGANK